MDTKVLPQRAFGKRTERPAPKRVEPCITAATVRQAQRNVARRRAVDAARQRALRG